MTTLQETLHNHGWKPIVSERQAMQLQRRELKWQTKRIQRTGIGTSHDVISMILDIRPGNWFKLLKSSSGDITYPRWSLLIYRMPRIRNNKNESQIQVSED